LWRWARGSAEESGKDTRRPLKEPKKEKEKEKREREKEEGEGEGKGDTAEEEM